jgi:Skp family chaperone for outer membrane proteins
MKKNICSSLTALVLTLFISIKASAATPSATTENPAKISKTEKLMASEEGKAILSRLEEIKAMDKSEMTAKEKRELRKEVRALKAQAAQIGGGVYISAGALIVILLLILLL